MADESIFVGNLPVNKFNRSSTNFLLQRIGCYSLRTSFIKTTREYIPDRSMLRYVSFPGAIVELDLTEGYDLLPKDADINHAYHGLDELLKWILSNFDKLKLFDRIPTIPTNTDFICFRGVILKIMITPYQNLEDWLLYAMKYKGTIYIVQRETEANEENKNKIEQLRILSYTGHRFEDYLCFYKDKLDISLGEKNEFCCVFRATLNEHSLVYGAEIDGVLNKQELDKELELINFVEVKTSATITDRRKYAKFCKYKLLKWWAQSYLGGVGTIFCGHRDKDLFVRYVSPMKIEEIKSMGQGYWQPNVCLTFLDSFFTFVKKCIKEETTLYKFYFNPKRSIVCTKVNPSEYEVIPDWYKQSLQE